MDKKITITFLNGNSITYGENEWDDYDFENGFIAVKRGDSWAAVYNAREVFRVVLEK